MVGERWLSVDEVAAYLGVKRLTVYRWIDKRGLPAHKSGKLWLLNKDEVDRWVRLGSAKEDAPSPASPGLSDHARPCEHPKRPEDVHGQERFAARAIQPAASGVGFAGGQVAEAAPAGSTAELGIRRWREEGRSGLELLDAPSVSATPDAARAQVGVVMGLASGVDMPVRIEALSLAGEGKVLPVGAVGRVMPESIAAAVAFVRAHLSELGIQAAAQDLTNIAVIAEIGDIPVQSDTLGAAVAVGLVSMLTRAALRRGTAVVGRISPAGELLPTGDIPQRLHAGIRGGIRDVFVPEENAEEARALPFLQDWPMKVVPTGHVSKILQLASTRSQLELDMFRMAGDSGHEA